MTIKTIINENSNNNEHREYVVLSHPYDGCDTRSHGYEGSFPTEEEAVSYCKAHVMSCPELEYTIIIMDHEDAEQIKNCNTETADRTAHEYDWHDWYNIDNTTEDSYKYVLWADNDDDTADDLCTWGPGEIDENDINEDAIYNTLLWIAHAADEEIKPTTYHIDKMIGYETVEEICRLLPYEIIERNEKLLSE